jgi:hypothetical protein
VGGKVQHVWGKNKIHREHWCKNFTEERISERPEYRYEISYKDE